MSNRLCVMVGAFTILFGGLPTELQAKVPIPIPYVWGMNDEISDIGELPPDASEAVAKQLGATVTVSFLYRRLHLFYLTLWTWNGHHVLRSGDNYWDVSAAEWSNLLGDAPAKHFATPKAYYFPLVPTCVVAGVVAFVIQRLFFMSDLERRSAMLDDKLAPVIKPR